MSNDRSIRLSQTLAPFGVGAIYDILGESLVACDTAMWHNHGTPIRLDRLKRDLGVSGFRSAPSHVDLYRLKGPRLPFARFPQWLFCPRCRRMDRWWWSDEEPDEPPRCRNESCRGSALLVPMRFIVICKEGHMDEVPWSLWAHVGPSATKAAPGPGEERCRSTALSFVARREARYGTGLASLWIKCNECGSENNLTDLSQSDSLYRFRISCSGKQPWQRNEEAKPCKATPQVVQRGASNVHFPTVHSALDIPPASNYSSYSDAALDILNASEFRVIIENPDGALDELMVELLARKHKITEQRVHSIIQRERDEIEGRRTAASGVRQDLKTEEWLAFQEDYSERDVRDRFITNAVHFIANSECLETQSHQLLAGLVSRVMVATRLREVRALQGFSRLQPDNQPRPKGRMIDPALGRGGIDWLPAIEVFGEGIFLALDESAVSRWERGTAVVAAAGRLETRRKESLLGPRLGVPATPRFVLLHTLAHVLIRQLAFDCGYSAASLRERVYSQTSEAGRVPQAGILIFTAAGDSEGTLGGLVRRGKPPLLRQSLMRSLENAGWCSADPLCIESDGQALGSLNIGACHACTLASETSCAHFNLLLDRRFLIGADDVPGFFEPVLSAARAEASARGLT